MRARCGRSTVTPRRLCCRALTMRMTESDIGGEGYWVRQVFGRAARPLPRCPAAPRGTTFPANVPPPDPQAPPPRLRVLRAGLAGRVRNHARLRERPAGVLQGPRADPVGLGSAG